MVFIVARYATIVNIHCALRVAYYETTKETTAMEKKEPRTEPKLDIDKLTRLMSEIHRRRHLLDISQNELALKAEIDKAGMSRFNTRGQNLTLARLDLIAKALNTKTTYLVAAMDEIKIEQLTSFSEDQMGRVYCAIPDEEELIKAYRSSSAEGKKLILANALAMQIAYPAGKNIVPISLNQKPPRRKK